jgi:hypothetical protein
MIQLYFNGKPCEIVSRDSADGTVCIIYAADHPHWPFPNYTWVSPKVLKKVSKERKTKDDLKDVPEALF